MMYALPSVVACVYMYGEAGKSILIRESPQLLWLGLGQTSDPRHKSLATGTGSESGRAGAQLGV